MGLNPVIRNGIAAFVLLSPAWAGASEPPSYNIDPVHTRVVFLVGHAGFSRSIATVSGVVGALHFDPGQWEDSRVDVRLPVARIDFGDEDWNQRMLARGFFDERNHPEVRFRSTRVEPLGDGAAMIHGDLSIAGTTRAVSLSARLNEAGRNPVNFRRTVGFSATTRLDRREFGLDRYPNVIGNEVEVIIELEATRGRITGDVEAAGPAAADRPVPPEEER
ncbi:YceI family protein [Alkalisalibacterium limincola]|uniref:YceI family protein n=1 Tax=Alkalisalibacterium limincola TaxID=2699169 RepID=A0A5C8KQE5_9GAMM|nr:YceI family protein [Alkalisalibacterium limincola]TXK62653.1 YceI family protein [Alkalisalibacterium limincola]